MFKKFLLIIVLGISLMALTTTEAKAQRSKSYTFTSCGTIFNPCSYKGCLEVAGVPASQGDPATYTGTFKPTDAWLVGTNNAGREVLLGLGQSVQGVSTKDLPAIVEIDDQGRVTVCVDLASHVAECDDADPKDSSLFRFGSPGAADPQNCADFLPSSVTAPNTASDEQNQKAWMSYWGINPDVLKPNQYPHSLRGTAWEIGSLVDVKNNDIEGAFNCLTDTESRYWDYELVLFRCVFEGEAVGFDDDYFFKRTVNEVAAPGILGNDVDTSDPPDDLTVTDVQFITGGFSPVDDTNLVWTSEDAGTITLYPNGGFLWDLTDKDFHSSVQWTYRPDDGSSGQYKGYPATVTVKHR